MSLLKEYGIKEDPRFKQARKESLRIMYLVIFEFIWVFTFAYIGTLSNPNNYSYILGFPIWFFWAFVGAGIVFPLIAIVLSMKTKDCSLTDNAEIPDVKNEDLKVNDKNTKTGAGY
ncbi:DUF997 family protein [Virgibacillus oceani]